MESKAFLSLLISLLIATSAIAAKPGTYRWKDKDGDIHFGSAVPAEYADQPYDIINSSGMVIEHVEPGGPSPEVQAQVKEQKKLDEKSKNERQVQSDRMLLLQYPTEADLQIAMDLKLEQIGFDSMLIANSYDNTNAAIKDKVRLAADQQRAGIPVTEAQTNELARLYRSLKIDKVKLAAISGRQDAVRAQFAAQQVRYRALVEKYSEANNNSADQDSSAEPALKDQN